MDDFQLRVVRAAERLAGRDGPDFGDRFDLLLAGLAAADAKLGLLNTRLVDLKGSLDLVSVRLAALIAVQQAILAKMPGPP